MSNNKRPTPDENYNREYDVRCYFFRDCAKDEEITRDYLEGIEAQNDQNRESLKNIWMEVDMTDEDWHQVEPDEEYFLVDSFC